MDDQKFWRLIDEARNAAGDQEARVEALTAALTRLGNQEIVAFQLALTNHVRRSYTWPLWGAAGLIKGHLSDDTFEYFRSWLIYKGQAAYEAAMVDPDSLASTMDDEDDEAQYECESLLTAALEAWEQKTGKSWDDFPDEGQPIDVPAMDDEPSEWTVDELRKHFPKLWAKFGR